MPSQLSCLGSSVVERSVKSVECRGFKSDPRQLIFIRKSDCLGCAVLLCLVCLTLLASFFLPSHLSLKHVYIYNELCTTYMYVVHNVYIMCILKLHMGTAGVDSCVCICVTESLSSQVHAPQVQARRTVTGRGGRASGCLRPSLCHQPQQACERPPLHASL